MKTSAITKTEGVTERFPFVQYSVKGTNWNFLAQQNPKGYWFAYKVNKDPKGFVSPYYELAGTKNKAEVIEFVHKKALELEISVKRKYFVEK